MLERVVPSLCLMGIALLSPVTARAQAADAALPTLELYPKTAPAFMTDSYVETRVVIRNPGKPITRATLHVYANGGFKPAAEPPKPFTVKTGDSFASTTRIRLSGAHLPGSVQFELEYRTEGSTATGRLYQTLEIPVAASPVPAKSVELTVKGSFSAVSAERPGVGYLLFANALDVPVSVRHVTLASDDGSISLDGGSKSPGEPIADFVLAPRSAVSRDIRLTAASRVTPGRHAVVFHADADWDRAGEHETRQLVLSQDVTVGVVFESDVLKALGVPSFLLLPGCLFLFTMQSLAGFGVLGGERNFRLPKLTVTAPEFWIISVTFSGLFAFVYAMATHTDYLLRYGAVDLRNVWLTSIALGVAAYVLIAGVTKFRDGRTVPLTTDGPVETLTKMGHRDASVQAQKITFTLGSATVKAFAIEPIADGQAAVWMTPPIAVRWTDTSAEGTAAYQELAALIDARRPAGEFAAAIRSAQRKRYATVAWQVIGGITGPRHVLIAAVTNYEAAESLVVVEVV